MFCVFAAWRGSRRFWHERDQRLEEGLHGKEHRGVHLGWWDWAHPPWPHGKLCECVGKVLWMWSRTRIVLESTWKSWSVDSPAVFRALSGLKVGENLKHRVLRGLWKSKVRLCKFCCCYWLLYVYVLHFFSVFCFHYVLFCLVIFSPMVHSPDFYSPENSWRCVKLGFLVWLLLGSWKMTVGGVCSLPPCGTGSCRYAFISWLTFYLFLFIPVL